MAKMYGRLGWRGQCSCCNGPRGWNQIRGEEKRLWKREAEEAVATRVEKTVTITITCDSPGCGSCTSGASGRVRVEKAAIAAGWIFRSKIHPAEMRGLAYCPAHHDDASPPVFGHSREYATRR